MFRRAERPSCAILEGKKYAQRGVVESLKENLLSYMERKYPRCNQAILKKNSLVISEVRQCDEMRMFIKIGVTAPRGRGQTPVYGLVCTTSSSWLFQTCPLSIIQHTTIQIGALFRKKLF